MSTSTVIIELVLFAMFASVMGIGIYVYMHNWATASTIAQSSPSTTRIIQQPPTPSPSKPNQPTKGTTPGTGITPTGTNQEAFDVINKFRQQQGVQPLAYDASKDSCTLAGAQMDKVQGFHSSFKGSTNCGARGRVRDEWWGCDGWISGVRGGRAGWWALRDHAGFAI